MRTPYEQENQRFSDNAHQSARKFIYPEIFNVPFECLKFDDTRIGGGYKNGLLDGEMGIDKILKISITNLHEPIKFTIQERFRRMEWASKRDLTITEYNNLTNQPSELYKLHANLFLYGYYDDINDIFGEVIAVNVFDFLKLLLDDKIKYEKIRNKKYQDFLAFKFDDLEFSGCIRFHKSNLKNNYSKTPSLEAYF